MKCKFGHNYTQNSFKQECTICNLDSKLHICYINDLLGDIGGKVITNTETVKDVNSIATFKCMFGHTFDLTFGDVFYNNIWCNECPINVGYILCSVILDEFFRDYDFYYVNKKYVTMDFYCKELKLGIIYNGIDKYGLPDFVDESKDRKGSINELMQNYVEKKEITIIVIPYTLPYGDYRSYLYDQILLNKDIADIIPKRLVPDNLLLKIFKNECLQNKYTIIENLGKCKKIDIQNYNIVDNYTPINVRCLKCYNIINVTPKEICFNNNLCKICL